jgi:hypothetical protein
MLCVSEALSLEQAVLSVGHEDTIPLPELVDAEEVREALARSRPDRWLAVSEVLSALIRSNRIRVYRGHWANDDPPELDETAALQAVEDRRSYSWQTEPRISFVNVENVRPDSR